MYVYICMYMFVYIICPVCVYIHSMYVCIDRYVCMYVYVHIYLHMYVCMYVFMYVLYVCMCVYACIGCILCMLVL